MDIITRAETEKQFAAALPASDFVATAGCALEPVFEA